MSAIATLDDSTETTETVIDPFAVFDEPIAYTFEPTSEGKLGKYVLCEGKSIGQIMSFDIGDDTVSHFTVPLRGDVAAESFDNLEDAIAFLEANKTKPRAKRASSGKPRTPKNPIESALADVTRASKLVTQLGKVATMWHKRVETADKQRATYRNKFNNAMEELAKGSTPIRERKVRMTSAEASLKAAIVTALRDMHTVASKEHTDAKDALKAAREAAAQIEGVSQAMIDNAVSASKIGK